MPFNQERAIQLIRKYMPRTLNAIASLPISEEDKMLMHSQFKVDSAYMIDYRKSVDYGPEFFNEEALAKKYGRSSFRADELDRILQIDRMNELAR